MSTQIAPSLAERSPLAIGRKPADRRADLAHLQDFIARMRAEEPRILGFPGNLDFDYSELGGLLSIFLNNVGDPSSPDASDVHTKSYEREAIRFLTTVAGGDPERTYGYVTASGSESNLFGLHVARERLPLAPLYCSEHAHYAIRKAAHLLRIELVEIPTGSDRGIDLDALAAACAQRPGRGAIVVATVGTTMHGAIDNVEGIREATAVAGETHVHVDAASGGLAAAFAPEPRPRWGFDAGADSVTISGHKLIGMPVPCGIAMARAELVPSLAAGEYTGATDSTLGCSRSGLAALLLWHALRRRGRDGLKAELRRALAVADYAERRLEELGYHPWRHPASLTVTFVRPSASVCAKWHLPTQGPLAHVMTVPHVTREAIDALCNDLVASRRPCLPAPTFAPLDEQTDERLRDWLEHSVMKPHPDLGRSGPMCPFVGPSRNAGALLSTSYAWPEGETNPAVMARMLEAGMDLFDSMEWATDNAALHALIIVIKGLDEQSWWLVEAGHRLAKNRAVERGLMLGEFHPRCEAPAARNPRFRASRSPLPLVVVRRMAIHDIFFLHGNRAWFEQYRRRFGRYFADRKGGDQHLAGLYRRAHERWLGSPVAEAQG